MFKLVFSNRIKYYLRSKEYLFWMLIFPILLSTLFNFAFANLLSGEEMETIPVAIVADEKAEEGIEMQVYRQIFAQEMFEASYINEEKAKEELEQEKIAGYISFTGGTHLVVAGNGYAQTVLQEIMNYVNQQISAITRIYLVNMGEVSPEFEAAMQETKSYIRDLTVSHEEPNLIVVYFYTVLAMTAFFASNGGVLEVMSVQANQSSVAMRVNLAPVGKMRIFLPSVLAAELLQIIVLIIVMLYIRFALGIDFGSRYGLILLNTIVGSLAGMGFGTMIGAIVKKNETFKTGVCIGFTMFCCFLSGMMGSDVKYMVKEAVPVVDRLNPVNLITEGYYKLFYYDTLGSFWQNIGILTVMTVICFGVTIWVLRRQRYDSI